MALLRGFRPSCLVASIALLARLAEQLLVAIGELLLELSDAKGQLLRAVAFELQQLLLQLDIECHELLIFRLQ